MLSSDPDEVPSRLEQLCFDKGLKMTEQRRVIARVLSDSADHPDVEQVYRRATEIDPRISIATVYRTVRLFEEANILARHEFGNEQIEKLQEIIADELGYELVGHRLELYAVPRRDKPQAGRG